MLEISHHSWLFCHINASITGEICRGRQEKDVDRNHKHQYDHETFKQLSEWFIEGGQCKTPMNKRLMETDADYHMNDEDFKVTDSCPLNLPRYNLGIIFTNTLSVLAC